MALTKVALIGANGRLGPHVLNALLNADNPSFTITVLSRHSSTSTYLSSVTVRHHSDDPSLEELVAILQGQEALITTFGGTNSNLQIKLADACVAAGVKRFIPADFGSCDSSSPLALELMPLYREKKLVREYLQHLAQDGKLTWTSLVTGHFFDFGLESGLLLMYVKEKKVTMIDEGEIMWSASTLERVGEAVVAVLGREDATRNRMLYVQSFCVSQKQVVDICEMVQGGKWEVEDVTREDFISKNKERMNRNPADHDARENLVGVVGIIDGDWRKKDGFANEMLGLKEENLEDVVRKVLEGQKG
jgi:putative NADH-flavin reductase